MTNNRTGTRGGRWFFLAGALALVAGLRFAPDAAAGTSGFLCPSSDRLISVGQHTEEVRRKCREPDDVQKRVELRTVRESRRQLVNGVWEDVTVENSVEVPIEEWFYDFGPSRFTKTLRFELDRLVYVVEGAKGSVGGS